MIIKTIENSEKVNFMELLLLADEDWKMIEKYLYQMCIRDRPIASKIRNRAGINLHFFSFIVTDASP